MTGELAELLGEIRLCRACDAHLEPNPVLHVHPQARILIVGQAPGRRVHQTGQSWNDPSGDRLRNWLGVGREEFYDPTKFALASMGFCYPGKGKSGDLPPRKECAALWRPRLLPLLPNIRLTLLVGQYAQADTLRARRKPSLTETVSHWREYLPDYVVTPHPSPRNIFWLQTHPWFNEEVVPYMQGRVREILGEG